MNSKSKLLKFRDFELNKICIIAGPCQLETE